MACQRSAVVRLSFLLVVAQEEGGGGARGWCTKGARVLCTEGGKGLVREGGKGLAATELGGAALGWLFHGGSDLGRVCCCHFNQRVRR